MPRTPPLLLVLFLTFAFVPSAVADVVYLYDDLGRLVRVIRENGEAASYHYDPVGNLLQIARESGVPQATTVASVSTSRLTQGRSTILTITGVNLVGATITSSTGITVTSVRSELDTLTVGVSVSSAAPLGDASLTVQTSLGSVTLPLTVVPPPLPVLVVSAGASVRFAPPPLAVDRSVIASVSVEVGGNLFTVE